MKIREHGIQQRERKRVYMERPKCTSNGQNFESVRLSDCFAAYLVLFYGLGASIGLMIFEFIYLSAKKRLLRCELESY